MPPNPKLRICCHVLTWVEHFLTERFEHTLRRSRGPCVLTCGIILSSSAMNGPIGPSSSMVDSDTSSFSLWWAATSLRAASFEHRSAQCCRRSARARNAPRSSPTVQ